MSAEGRDGAAAVASCDKALALLSSEPGQSFATARAIAGVWLLKGQILEREQQNPRLADALASYDHAIALLDRPDLDEAGRRELAVTWMNRGNVLQRSGDPAEVQKALEAYDATLRLLRPSVAADPMVRNTYGAALLNKGTALQRLNTAETHTQAAQAYDEAIETLAVRPAGYEQHFERLTAGAKLNRAGALLAAYGPARADEVAATGGELIESVAAMEEREIPAADLSLRARRLVCEAIGVRLQAAGVQLPPEAATWISDATDQAERALAVAQHWDHKGVFGFRPLVPWFLHFAATVYAHHQPQFLSEFLLDTLDAPGTPAPWKQAQQLKQIALQTIERLRAHVRARVLENLGAEHAQRGNELLAELQQAEKRLALAPPATTTTA